MAEKYNYHIDIELSMIISANKHKKNKKALNGS